MVAKTVEKLEVDSIWIVTIVDFVLLREQSIVGSAPLRSMFLAGLPKFSENPEVVSESIGIVAYRWRNY